MTNKTTAFFILLFLNCMIIFGVSGQDVIKIMPIGNSITSGYTDASLPVEQRRGYRYGLKFLLSSHGYTTDFVGTESGGSAFFSDCQHAGFGGTQDQYIQRLLTDGLITYFTTEWVTLQTIQPPGPYLDVFNPDIILLHIGTNDITHEGSGALANQKITAILDLVDQYEVRANKEVIVFVALILNRCIYSQQTTTFNDGIKALVQNRINSGDKLVIVDMEHDAGFVYMDDADMTDDLHPNEIGYNKMAALWCSSIEANYNTAPVITDIPDQIFNEGTSSNTISLDDYVSDIQDPDESISWEAVQLGTSYFNITINSNRQIVATPKDLEWSGSQTVVFTATDLGRSGKYIKSDTDTVIFSITPVNDPPVFTSTPETEVLVGNVYHYTCTCDDIDSPSVALSAVTKPVWLNFSTTTGVLTGTPSVSNQGINQVTLRCSDGLLNTNQAFTIDVKNHNALDEIKNAGFSIYPVPAQKYLMIVSDNFKAESMVEVLSIFGIIMKRIYLSPGEINYQLDLEGFDNGMYYLRLVHESNTYISKFIVIN